MMPKKRKKKRKKNQPYAGHRMEVAAQHAGDAAGVEVPDDHSTIVAAHGKEGATPVGGTATRVPVLQAVLDHLRKLIVERICFFFCFKKK